MYDPKTMDKYIDDAQKLYNDLLTNCRRFHKNKDLDVLDHVIKAARAYRATVKYNEGTYDINKD